MISFSKSGALNKRAGTLSKRAACSPQTSNYPRSYTNVALSTNLRPTTTPLKLSLIFSSPPPLNSSSSAVASWRCYASPSWNPQNCDQPLVLPSPQFSAEECVRAQLDALAKTDDPWPSHGIQLAYEFGLDIGGMDPSLYFGFPKDLYHLDHFMGQFQNYLPEMMNLTSYEILQVQQSVAESSPGKNDDLWEVVVAVTDKVEKVTKFKFVLKRKKVGARKGALMTAMISRDV